VVQQPLNVLIPKFLQFFKHNSPKIRLVLKHKKYFKHLVTDQDLVNLNLDSLPVNGVKIEIILQ